MSYDPTTLDEIVEVGGKRLVRCPMCSHGHWHTEPCRGCSGQAQRDYDAPKKPAPIAEQLPVRLPKSFGSVRPAPKPRPTMRSMGEFTKDALLEVAKQHTDGDDRMAVTIVEYYMQRVSVRLCRSESGINQRYIGKVYKHLDWHRQQKSV